MGSEMCIRDRGHTKVKNVHNMLSHGDTPICQNFVYLCQTFCQTQIHGEIIILILRSKVKVINVRDTLYHGDTFTCQTKYDYV